MIVFIAGGGSLYSHPMQTFRLVAGALAALTLALLAAGTFLPPLMNDQAALVELYFAAIVVPVLTLNLWAWTTPEIIEFYFLGQETEKK